jgi:hypothetical protein
MWRGEAYRYGGVGNKAENSREAAWAGGSMGQGPIKPGARVSRWNDGPRILWKEVSQPPYWPAIGRLSSYWSDPWTFTILL